MTDDQNKHLEMDRFIIETCAQIAIAYINKNDVRADDLKKIVRDIYDALSPACGSKQVAIPMETTSQQQDVLPKHQSESITADYLICLEDGKPYRSLKRHLKSQYNMTPDEYRKKWGLPEDYPMVAPNYSKLRSVLAKNLFGKESAA